MSLYTRSARSYSRKNFISYISECNISTLHQSKPKLKCQSILLSRPMWNQIIGHMGFFGWNGNTYICNSLRAIRANYSELVHLKYGIAFVELLIESDPICASHRHHKLFINFNREFKLLLYCHFQAIHPSMHHRNHFS